MTKNDGGPAYPIPTVLKNNTYMTDAHNGMSLRDAIAIAALPPLMAGMYASVANGHYKITEEQKKMSFAALIAEEAYVQADAMLAEREK